jgi:hypothetical protein
MPYTCPLSGRVYGVSYFVECVASQIQTLFAE